MNNTWIGFDGMPYSSEKEKLKADREYITKLEKIGKRTFIGFDGLLYFNELDFLKANRIYLNEQKPVITH